MVKTLVLAIELKEEKITTTPACRGHMCTLVTDRVEPETPNNMNFSRVADMAAVKRVKMAHSAGVPQEQNVVSCRISCVAPSAVTRA